MNRRVADKVHNVVADRTVKYFKNRKHDSIIEYKEASVFNVVAEIPILPLCKQFSAHSVLSMNAVSHSEIVLCRS